MALELDTIRQQAQRVAASHGLDVVEVDLHGSGKHRSLRIFIEKNAEQRARLFAELAAAGTLPSAVSTMEALSGVTHEDCEVFSRDFGTLLDVEDLIPGSAEYTLEVSSPGLDRKLYTAADYARFLGGMAKVQTRAAVNGNRHWTGRIVASDGDSVTLDVSAMQPKKRGAGKAKAGRGTDEAAAQNQVRLDIANVEKAGLVPEI